MSNIYIYIYVKYIYIYVKYIYIYIYIYVKYIYIYMLNIYIYILNSKMRITYICNHENNVSSRLSLQWLCGNSCTWTHDVRLYICICVYMHIYREDSYLSYFIKTLF